MNEDLPASFADLLDSDYQDHVIAAMKAWCDNYQYTSGEAYANLVLADISRPLWAWIDETKQKRKPGNYRDIEASMAFAEKADAIVFILLHKTRPLYLEHVVTFNESWLTFHGSVAANLFNEAKILSDYIRDLPDPKILVDEELRKRREQVELEREDKKRNDLTKWQITGIIGSKESKNSRDDVLLIIAEKVLSEEKPGAIRSQAGFGRKIAAKIKKGSFYYETSKKEKKELKLRESSIRKNEKIITLHKKHFNYR